MGRKFKIEKNSPTNLKIIQEAKFLVEEKC